MPRQQNSQSKSQPPRIYAPPPKIWHASPPPTSLGPFTGTQPTIWQSMKQGFGLGAGSEVGHRVMGSLLGPSSSPASPASLSSIPLSAPGAPYFASEHYQQCVEYNKEKPEVCQPFMSKDKSPWTLCMEANFYRADLCSTEK